MTKKDRKRIEQLEAALRHIARQTAGYDSDSSMGAMHKCATSVLAGTGAMLAVRVIDAESVAGLDYGTIYSSCPTQFFRRSSADDWFFKLDNATSWPEGAKPRYHIVEIDGSIPVDVITGRPT